MSKEGLFVVSIIVSICYLIGFVCSLFTIRNSRAASDIKYFYIYSIVGMVFTILFWLPQFNVLPISSYFALNTLSIIFHFIFLSRFIVQVTPLLKDFKFSAILLHSINFLLILLVIYNFQMNTFALSFSFSNTILFLFCIAYYYSLLDAKPYKPILIDPVFWIVTGIFICTGISLPVNITNDYILFATSSRLNDYDRRMLSFIGVVPYAIMHLCFSKAYICELKMTSK